VPVAVPVVVVVIAPTVAITVTLAVPAVIVLESSSVAVPVAGEESFSIMMRHNPACARIGRKRPISGMPAVTPAVYKPIAIDPDEVRARSGRQNSNHARWWVRTDPNANRDLAEDTSCGQ